MAFSLIFTFTARFCYNLWRDLYDRSFGNKSWQRNDSKNYLDSITRLERYLKIVLRTVPPFKANRIVHKCCDVIYSLLFFFFYFILHSFYQIFRLLFCLPFFLASFFLFFFFYAFRFILFSIRFFRFASFYSSTFDSSFTRDSCLLPPPPPPFPVHQVNGAPKASLFVFLIRSLVCSKGLVCNLALCSAVICKMWSAPYLVLFNYF